MERYADNAEGRTYELDAYANVGYKVEAEVVERYELEAVIHIGSDSEVNAKIQSNPVAEVEEALRNVPAVPVAMFPRAVDEAQ